MNKTHTLKELADIGAGAANAKLPTAKYSMTVGLISTYPDHSEAREAFTKAILDAIGYEFPKNEEREAFDDWWKANRIAYCNEEHAFQLWKAGRKELLKAQALAKEPDTKTEPAWIPWWGNSKSPITGSQTKFEVECRDGKKFICNNNRIRWTHDGTAGDIIAYRILDPDQCEDTKTEPPWIPWPGGDKSPIVGKQTRYEVEFRDGAKAICVQNNLRWTQLGTAWDIIAYRILEP